MLTAEGVRVDQLAIDIDDHMRHAISQCNDFANDMNWNIIDAFGWSASACKAQLVIFSIAERAAPICR